MIRNEIEYQQGLRRLREDTEVMRAQREQLVSQGFSEDEVQAGLEPMQAFSAQLHEEVEWYEQVSRGNLWTLRRLTEIGRLLIAIRIARGMTQRELAERLGVSEAVVSRDEHNEYHGITVERAQRIMDVLEASTLTTVEGDAFRSTGGRSLTTV